MTKKLINLDPEPGSLQDQLNKAIPFEITLPKSTEPYYGGIDVGGDRENGIIPSEDDDIIGGY